MLDGRTVPFTVWESAERHRLETQKRLDDATKALAWMVADAYRSQRPGGGSGVPTWVEEALNKALGK